MTPWWYNLLVGVVMAGALEVTARASNSAAAAAFHHESGGKAHRQWRFSLVWELASQYAISRGAEGIQGVKAGHETVRRLELQP